MKIKIQFIACAFLLLTATIPNAAKFTTKQSKTIRKKHAKQHKQRPEHPYPNKLIKDMNEQELKATLDYAKTTQDKDFIFKVFYALLSQSSNQNNLKIYKLDLANYCFTIKDYEKGASLYEEYAIAYPSSQESEYAQYKALLCSFLLCLDPAKDQSITHKTIFMAEEFLKKAQKDEYIEESKKIYTICRKTLFEHEIHVFEQYLKQKKTNSAQHRYKYIEEHFKDIKHIEQYLPYLQKMIGIVKNPKTCPFIIKVDLKDALLEKIEMTSEQKQKTALFFLS